MLDGKGRAARDHDDGQDGEEDPGTATALGPSGSGTGRGRGRGGDGGCGLRIRLCLLTGERKGRYVGLLHVRGEGGPLRQPLGDRLRPQRGGERAVRAGAFEELGGGGAPLGILVEAGGDELGEVRLQLPQRLQIGLLVDDAVQHAVPRLVAERRLAARRVREYRAQREHIGGSAQPPPARGLFGRHVGGGAHDHAGPGQLALLGRPGHAEVDEGEPVQGQHDVGRLEVPVHHVQRVHRRQTRRGLPQQQPQGPRGQRPAVQGDGLAQGEAGDVRGGEPRGTGAAVAVEQRRGGVRGEPGEVVQLVPEAAQEVLVLTHDGGQELLDGDVPAFPDSEVHPAHASGPEPPRQRNGPDPAWIPRPQRLGPAPRQL